MSSAENVTSGKLKGTSDLAPTLPGSSQESSGCTLLIDSERTFIRSPGESVLLPCPCPAEQINPDRDTWRFSETETGDQTAVCNDRESCRGRIWIFDQTHSRNFSLLISDLTKEDAGFYTCRADEGDMPHIMLQVKGGTLEVGFRDWAVGPGDSHPASWASHGHHQRVLFLPADILLSPSLTSFGGVRDSHAIRYSLADLSPSSSLGFVVACSSGPTFQLALTATIGPRGWAHAICCALSENKQTVPVSRSSGGSVLLSCTCTDLQDRAERVQWRTPNHEDLLQRYSGRVQTFNQNSPGNLSVLISDLTEEDGGTYSCWINQNQYRNFSLTVKGIPEQTSAGTTASPPSSTPGLIIKTLEACKANATLDCTNNLLSQIDIIDQALPKKDVEDTLNYLITQQNSLITGKTNRDGLVFSFNRMLNATEKLVSTLVKTVETNSSVSISLKNIEVRVFVVGQNSSLKEMLQLHTPHAKMDIDLNGISRKKMNQGHAAVAFMSYTNMLNSSLFSANTSNTTKRIMSAVVSATLPKTNNRSLDKPVNFTLKHLEELNPNYVHSCVYWNETDWVTDGCARIKTNSSHTVCSSTHLSTFALIMQINPRQSEHRFKVINMVVVSFGLVFLGLALLTFALCRKNPRVINAARINLCISLLLGHLLFLLTQTLVKKKYQLVCAVLAGIVHFLFLSAFVWMFIEALMLFLAIKNLSRPKSKHKEVLNWKLLTSVGYMVALVVVGVSAGVVPDGYSSEECWLTTSKGFNWSFLGPVFFILASNMILFSLIAISLRSSLARLNSQVSQIKQTRTIFFKTMAQFVIFGCPWILGVFTANSEALEIIFLILNSQQGTFIFIVHCVLSKEVRQKYRKLLCGSCVTTYYVTSVTEVQTTQG
ncbi:adhesion G protein-coupled receptor E3-like [Colossoma macropomum]|uniref:adhesion G protein-coupled receptor E3-like n=1 Tax=Colossoma macropomum TaxID=42526 RepID=UPI0018655586|nr:adhesion G protein-coupled receptor E3-like [Colossoma macropomum]